MSRLSRRSRWDTAEQFDIPEAKTNLSRTVECVERGEETVSNRAGHAVAEVVPSARRAERSGRGSLRGASALGADWDSEETNTEIAVDFDTPE